MVRNYQIYNSRVSNNLEAQIGAAYKRRFFTTDKGYMGLFACDVRIGHKVVILKGGRTPYIVKEERRMYLKFFWRSLYWGIDGKRSFEYDG